MSTDYFIPVLHSPLSPPVRSPRLILSMKRFIYVCLAVTVTLALALSLATSRAEETLIPLEQVNMASEAGDDDFVDLLGFDDQLWGEAVGETGDRAALQTAIAYSLNYLQTSEAAADYANYDAIPAFTRDRVYRTLARFQQLLADSTSAAELQASVRQAFDLYRSIGVDGQGTVQFTGYFEPIYAASRTPTAEFRYPLYALPPDLNRWTQPHPTRRQLEGSHGQPALRLLQGLELVWLRDRLEAYLVQVQGSAQLQLTDGTIMSVGYAGRTDYPYVSVGRELVNDGKIAEAELSLPAVIDYFRQHPAEVDHYILRNNRFIFFRETTGSPAIGSLGVPVTPERSIATDKSLMPPGALALIQTQIPYSEPNGTLTPRLVSRYVLDQDTGGAIRGPGRVDIFMGSGEQAGDRAGLINGPGQLYYLLLKR
ncbi:murein transglycosylase A [Thermocoleostomius sinensis A174]|uniref:peptidoglycan lytic exotransglycosylase n=2 Tax=Thermocoleostomius TaxID=3065395 RepID=A0A9E9C9V3_9CYAN|nr:murein transglycosylase A [Thermocoleostomius sinensis]WAL58145.1 murein transglycosylase A [Thermocoleostomius sinensis A174]